LLSHRAKAAVLINRAKLSGVNQVKLSAKAAVLIFHSLFFQITELPVGRE